MSRPAQLHSFRHVLQYFPHSLSTFSFAQISCRQSILWMMPLPVQSKQSSVVFVDGSDWSGQVSVNFTSEAFDLQAMFAGSHFLKKGTGTFRELPRGSSRSAVACLISLIQLSTSQTWVLLHVV